MSDDIYKKLFNREEAHEKTNICHFIIVAVIAIIIGGATGAIIFYPKNTANSARIEDYTARERDLLTRIGEYQRREESRISAEVARIEREGRRIEQTEKRLGAIRQLDRRSNDLYEELAMEAGTLQDFYLNFKRDYYNSLDSSDSKKINSP